MQENHKITRIINEFSLFILENHSDNFKFELKLTDDEFNLIFETSRMSDDLIKIIKKRLIPEHDYNLEEYGWELMGDGDGLDDLELIGSLLDGLDIISDQNNTKIIMKRKL